jgi:hypothetical protein
MEARYAFRKSQLLAECPVASEMFEQVMPRLYTFMKLFVSIFQGQAAEQHAKTSVCGLLSNVERKNIASIAYRFGQSRLPLQGFIGWDTWDDAPLREELRGQVASRAYHTRHQLALERLAAHGASLPHGWMAGDDEMRRPYWFRRRLAALDERYLLAVPSNTAIRDRETPLPEYWGKGRRPTHPWHSVQAWSQALDATAWRRIDVRDGAKGLLVVEIVKRCVVSRTHRRQQGDKALLVVMRYRDHDQAKVVKVDYYLSNVVPETPLWELARVAKAEHRIEECLQRSRSEAGLADDEVRHWTGWQHHHTLSLLATWSWCWKLIGGKNGPLR